MAPGRKREEAPEGMMLPREAAQVLGVSVETVKKYIRDGSIAGTYGPNEAGEVRYYAAIPSVEAYSKSREIERMFNVAHDNTREQLIAEIRRNRIEVSGKLDRIIENQESQKRDREEYRRILLEATEKEKEHQERTRAHERRISDFLDEFGDRIGPKRPWWRRWFGVG